MLSLLFVAASAGTPTLTELADEACARRDRPRAASLGELHYVEEAKLGAKGKAVAIEAAHTGPLLEARLSPGKNFVAVATGTGVMLPADLVLHDGDWRAAMRGWWEEHDGCAEAVELGLGLVEGSESCRAGVQRAQELAESCRDTDVAWAIVASAGGLGLDLGWVKVRGGAAAEGSGVASLVGQAEQVPLPLRFAPGHDQVRGCTAEIEVDAQGAVTGLEVRDCPQAEDARGLVAQWRWWPVRVEGTAIGWSRVLEL